MAGTARLTGLIAATFTPMHPDGAVNLDLIPPLVEHLIATGVKGLYVNGSTGEGPSLTTAERRAVAEAYVQAASGRIPVIVHVGHDSLAEARGLATHAAEIGATAVAAMPPAYFKCGTMEALVSTVAHIAEASPQLPFFYYHIPALNGYRFSMVEFLQTAPARIPNLAGIKFSDPNLCEYQACLEFDGGRYDILFGVDEMLLGAVAVGSKGAVGSTYNFAAPVYLKAIEAYRAGDVAQARAHHSRAVSLVRTVIAYGGQPALKTMMSFLGLDCGPSRLPLVSLSADQKEALRRDVEKLGVLSLGAVR